MKNATSSVEFSFNNTMYKQTDGVAMGSPLIIAIAAHVCIEVAVAATRAQIEKVFIKSDPT